MLAERFKIVPIASALDLAGAATNSTDSINMKNYHRATFLIHFGTLGVANHTLYVYSGATDAAETSALTFRYAYGGAAAGAASCDVLSAWATSAALVVVQATYSNYLLVVDVMADEMDVTNQEEWITLDFKDNVGGGGATGLVTVTAILEPRYTQNRSATALA